MFLMNLNRNVNKPMQTAKAIKADRTKVKPAEPMYELEPFESYEGIPHQDVSLMGYDYFGNYTATSMAREARQKAFMNMANNNSIINLMNGKRRGEF